jgi:hypothetical protein
MRSIALHLVQALASIVSSLRSVGLLDLYNSELLFDCASSFPLAQPEEDSNTDKDDTNCNTNADSSFSSW